MFGKKHSKISPDEAIALMDAGDVTILDVRTKEEYAVGHIKNCVLLTNTEIAAKAATVLPDKNAKIIVYCASGMRSAGAAKLLAKMGYTHIYDMGGLVTWPYGTVH
jgi:phage shock protein E